MGGRSGECGGREEGEGGWEGKKEGRQIDERGEVEGGETNRGKGRGGGREGGEGWREGGREGGSCVSRLKGKERTDVWIGILAKLVFCCGRAATSSASTTVSPSPHGSASTTVSPSPHGSASTTVSPSPHGSASTTVSPSPHCRYVGREPVAAPATGCKKTHTQEQEDLVLKAIPLAL